VGERGRRQVDLNEFKSTFSNSRQAVRARREQVNQV
jgi:hypothetical protein